MSQKNVPVFKYRDVMKIGRLSPREQATVGVLLWWPGITNRSIARLLGISVGTVKWHLHSALQKLKVRDRHQLCIKYGIQKGVGLGSPKFLRVKIQKPRRKWIRLLREQSWKG